MNATRIQRLLKLIGLLQVGRGYNVEALAHACGVSRRTIFRDLLRTSGQKVEIRLGSTNPLTGQEPIYEQLTEAQGGNLHPTAPLPVDV